MHRFLYRRVDWRDYSFKLGNSCQVHFVFLLLVLPVAESSYEHGKVIPAKAGIQDFQQFGNSAFEGGKAFASFSATYGVVDKHGRHFWLRSGDKVGSIAE